MDGPIHMAFGGKVHNRSRLMLVQQIADQFPVADIAMNKAVAFVGGNFLQVAEIPGVGQLVKIYDRRTLSRKPLQHEV
jgi:hypothetical protein